MPKLTITQAVKVIPVSESKLRRDLKSGVVSCEVDEKGKKRFDTSELRRVYGELAMPDESQPVSESHQPLSKTGHDTSEILALKDNQITDLQKQLEKAEMRETALIDEKAKLLDLLSDTQNLLSAEKEEKKALMLPPADEKPKSRNWLLRLVGAR